MNSCGHRVVQSPLTQDIFFYLRFPKRSQSRLYCFLCFGKRDRLKFSLLSRDPNWPNFACGFLRFRHYRQIRTRSRLTKAAKLWQRKL